MFNKNFIPFLAWILLFPAACAIAPVSRPDGSVGSAGGPGGVGDTLLFTQTVARGESQEGPVITDFFASSQIRPGEPWKVYINAKSAGGKMCAFIFKISLPGGAVCPLAQMEIKEPYGRRLSGSLSLPMGILDYLEPENLVLNLQIKDNAGRLSAPAFFPLMIDPKAEKENPKAGIFEEVHLGPIQRADSGRIILVGVDESVKRTDH